MTNQLTVIGGDRTTWALDQLGKDPALQSPNTRRTYAGALCDFENWRAGRPLTKGLIEEYATYLRDEHKLAATTINHKLSAVRWLARRMGDAVADDLAMDPERRRAMIEMAARVAQVENVKGDTELRGRYVPAAELRALLQGCADEGTPGAIRDAAILAMAAATGMRRSEILALTLADLAPLDDDYELQVRHAKGNKHRELALLNGARRYLTAWLDLRGDAPGAVFVAIRKGGAILDHGLSGQSAQEMLHRRAAAAGIPDLNWHDFRRTFATDLLEAGIDIVLVQYLLGHASPVTTGKYDRRPAAARRKALRVLHLPYLLKGGGK